MLKYNVFIHVKMNLEPDRGNKQKVGKTKIEKIRGKKPGQPAATSVKTIKQQTCCGLCGETRQRTR